jgi:hypothetical protein
MMIFVCPNCAATLSPNDLRVSLRDAMVLGNSRLCPSCGIEVCYYPDYGRIILISTLPLLLIALRFWGVEAGLWTCITMLIAWWFGLACRNARPIFPSSIESEEGRRCGPVYTSEHVSLGLAILANGG